MSRGQDAGPGRNPRPGRSRPRGPGQERSPEPGQHSRPASGDGQLTLRVNPIACDARGLCIELLPELIAADPWGYPIIRPGPVPPGLLPLARRAVRECPTLALLLTRDPGSAV